MAQPTNKPAARYKKGYSEGYPGILFYTVVLIVASLGMILYEYREEYDQQMEPKPLVQPKPKPIPVRGSAGYTSETAAPPAAPVTMPVPVPDPMPAPVPAAPMPAPMPAPAAPDS